MNVFKSISDKYKNSTGISDVRESQEKYDKAIDENTGTKGMNKAAMQGQLGATAVGANAAENAKVAASSAGASKGAASALGETAMAHATNNAVADETKKALDKNNEIVSNRAKELEAAQSDMNSKADLISKVGTTAGSLIGTAVGGYFAGPLGATLGSSLGAATAGLGTTGLNYANQRYAASDENLKTCKRVIGIGKNYQPKIKRVELLMLKTSKDKKN